MLRTYGHCGPADLRTSDRQGVDGEALLTDPRIAGPPFPYGGQWHLDLHSEADYRRARLRPGTPAPALRALLERVWGEQRPDTPADETPGTPVDPSF